MGAEEMSSLLADDVVAFEAVSFRTMRPPYVLTSTSSDDPPYPQVSRRHLPSVGEPWTNATGVIFAVENVAELAAGEVLPGHIESERVIPDTEHARAGDFLARTLDSISRPIERENTPVSFDPDDYPLF
jgi:hypothetical protein